MCNSELLAVLVEAANAGMKVVREGQYASHGESEVKMADATLFTETDRNSGEAIARILRAVPALKLHGEDTEGHSGSTAETLLCWFDPLDGTRGFAIGLATSTVIIALYDESRHRLMCVLVGEPATGRVWMASEGESTKIFVFDHATQACSKPKPVHVWNGTLSVQSSVCLDVPHGFNRGERQLFTDQDIARLFTSLNSEVKLFIPGSNGLIQALVANGGDRMVGSITTAQGGPWDACGGLLVQQAGGAARAFRLENRKLEERDPLNPLSFDILLTGNTRETVDYLTSKIGGILE